MPETKGDFIHIPVRDASEFTNKCATITLDKDEGIKALICRRKDKDTTAVRTVMFPKDKFNMDQAKKWIADHENLESYYVKDLLYTGTWPHPQQPDQDVHMTLSMVRKIYTNIKDFLAKGGNIPVIYPPHTYEEVDAIDQTVGFLQDVIQLDDQSKFYGILKLNALATAWAREGKIKAVSPSIVTNVRTAHGEYEVLFDHVCITQEPYLTKQETFKPMIAEAYSKAIVLYESTSMTYPGKKKENGGSMLEEIKKRVGTFLNDRLYKEIVNFVQLAVQEMKPDSKESPDLETEKGEDAMKLEQLEAEITQLKADNAALKKENEDLTKRITEFEATKQKAALEAFKSETEGLVKEGKLTAVEATELITVYESLKDKKEIKFGDATKPITEVILAPYKARTKKVTDTKLSAHSDKIRHGEKVFDLSTAQGRNEFAEQYSQLAKTKDIPLEEARNQLLAESQSEE
jgi:hypothetical protein